VRLLVMLLTALKQVLEAMNNVLLLMAVMLNHGNVAPLVQLLLGNNAVVAMTAVALIHVTVLPAMLHRGLEIADVMMARMVTMHLHQDLLLLLGNKQLPHILQLVLTMDIPDTLLLATALAILQPTWVPLLDSLHLLD